MHTHPPDKSAQCAHTLLAHSKLKLYKVAMGASGIYPALPRGGDFEDGCHPWSTPSPLDTAATTAGAASAGSGSPADPDAGPMAGAPPASGNPDAVDAGPMAGAPIASGSPAAVRLGSHSGSALTSARGAPGLRLRPNRMHPRPPLGAARLPKPHIAHGRSCLRMV